MNKPTNQPINLFLKKVSISDYCQGPGRRLSTTSAWVVPGYFNEEDIFKAVGRMPTRQPVDLHGKPWVLWLSSGENRQVERQVT